MLVENDGCWIKLLQENFVLTFHICSVSRSLWEPSSSDYPHEVMLLTLPWTVSR